MQMRSLSLDVSPLPVLGRGRVQHARQPLCDHHAPCASGHTGSSTFPGVNGHAVPQQITGTHQDASTCSTCEGKGAIACKACFGAGHLRRGGYNKKTTLNLPRILNSKWTAMQETMGWRHFRVTQKRKLPSPTGAGSGLVFLQMTASCDESVKLWLNSDMLKIRENWASGWLQMHEMRNIESTLAGTGVECQVCKASGTLPCPECDASGVAYIGL